MIDRALTIRHPWAWLVAHGYKPVENRSKPPPKALIGQRVAIHASRRLDDDARDSALVSPHFDRNPDEFMKSLVSTFGCILGTAVLTGHVTASDSPWFTGPYGWLFADPIVLAEPIPAKGALGFWRLPSDITSRLTLDTSGVMVRT